MVILVHIHPAHNIQILYRETPELDISFLFTQVTVPLALPRMGFEATTVVHSVQVYCEGMSWERCGPHR